MKLISSNGGLRIDQSSGNVDLTRGKIK